MLLQKAQAKLEIDKAKKAKLTAIEGTPNATKEEKDAAKQAAQDAATKANQAIDAATDNAGVATAQTDGIAAIEAVTPTVAVKANVRKESKELPNTGTADSTVAMVAAAASAVLGLGLVGRRRKEDEEV